MKLLKNKLLTHENNKGSILTTCESYRDKDLASCYTKKKYIVTPIPPQSKLPGIYPPDELRYSEYYPPTYMKTQPE